MAKVVTINSSINIYVLGTSYTQNNGDERNKVALNPSSWMNTSILINQGIHDYPCEIASWASVQALVSQRLITISEAHEGSAKVEDENAVKAKEKADEEQKEEKIANTKKRMRKAKLDELADIAVENEFKKAVDESK